jgi:hypothetical protein
MSTSFSTGLTFGGAFSKVASTNFLSCSHSFL